MLDPMTSALAKTPAAIASAVLIAVLTGCGGGDGANSDYCKDLETAQPTLSSLKSEGAGQLQDVFKVTHELAREAPRDIKDDWAAFEQAITKIEEAFKAAGIGPKELVQLQKGEIPDGVKVEKLQGLPAKFQALDSPEIAKAQKAIRAHAKDVCKVTFES
jgi:hypothetical protein